MHFPDYFEMNPLCTRLLAISKSKSTFLPIWKHSHAETRMWPSMSTFWFSKLNYLFFGINMEPHINLTNLTQAIQSVTKVIIWCIYESYQKMEYSISDNMPSISPKHDSLPSNQVLFWFKAIKLLHHFLMLI